MITTVLQRSIESAQYAAHEYRKLLTKWQVSQSKSGAGNCNDNAVAEAFFASLRKERLRSHGALHRRLLQPYASKIARLHLSDAQSFLRATGSSG